MMAAGCAKSCSDDDDYVNSALINGKPGTLFEESRVTVRAFY